MERGDITMKKTTFALFFGNRGFMPEKLIADARREMVQAVEKAGFDYLIMDENSTRYGAVETRKRRPAFTRNGWINIGANMMA
jgi:L-fucose isomerase-like protein